MQVKDEKEYHLMSKEDLRKKFDIDFSRGLEPEQAAALLKKYGKNLIQISYLRLYKNILLDITDNFSLMLWVTMILSILSYTPTGNPPQISSLITASVVGMILIAKAILAGIQSYNSIKSMRGIQSAKQAKINVLRGGQVIKVVYQDLVIGDLVYLKSNQRVPADLRIIEAKGMLIYF